MFKRHLFLIISGVLVALMVLAAVLRLALADDGKGPSGPGASGGERGQLVSEVAVVEQPFSDQLRVLGVARGRRSVNITSNTTELITRVMFADGQRVAAGAPLVELQARQEDAGVIEARAQVLEAQREFDRFNALAERGVAPRVSAETAETALERAKALLAAAEARRGERVIRAPFAGVLGLTTVTPGTLVNPGAVITTLDDVSVIRVDFPLPERYLSALRPGTPIVASADAFEGETFAGRIALIDTRVNEETRAATARAEFPNPGGRIRPGMMIRVTVEQGQRTAASVPEAAVQYEGQGAFVYRIVQGEQGSTAQRVEVEAGAVEAGRVEIRAGLRPGERVVASGLNRIQPNAPVHVASDQPQSQSGPGQAARSAAS